MPCFKLGNRFGRPDLVKRFQRSGRTGFYLAVLREREVTAGDSLGFLAQDKDGVTVADIVSLDTADAANQEVLRRASELPALPEGWRDCFRKHFRGPGCGIRQLERRRH